MNVETSKLRSTKEILDAVIERLEDLQAAGGSAFDRVEMFDLTDYADAMQRLAMNQGRTALVIWTGDDFESRRETVMLTTRRTAVFDVFVTDRRLDAPVKALTGDAEKNLPGALGLRDLVLTAVTGEILAADADSGAELIYGVPQSVERGIVSSEDKTKFPGRQILIVTFHAVGEWMQVGVGYNEAISGNA